MTRARIAKRVALAAASNARTLVTTSAPVVTPTPTAEAGASLNPTEMAASSMRSSRQPCPGTSSSATRRLNIRKIWSRSASNRSAVSSGVATSVNSSV